jgi:hypothetical protein
MQSDEFFFLHFQMEHLKDENLTTKCFLTWGEITTRFSVVHGFSAGEPFTPVGADGEFITSASEERFCSGARWSWRRGSESYNEDCGAKWVNRFDQEVLLLW